MDIDKVNELIKKTEKTLTNTNKVTKDEKLLVGVDLGTACIVIVVLNNKKEPVACEVEYAKVVKDGLVVDYIGALNIVKNLKEKLEVRLGRKLEKAAIAIPPGVSKGDTKTHQYIVEGAGFEVTNILDEPTAANAVLGLENGVIVDIGGGTTGISIIENGQVTKVEDEPTGGTHLSLVIAGNYGIDFDQAEAKKMDKNKQAEILPIVTPVIQKMASIVNKTIEGHKVNSIHLVGGTCILKDFETIFEKEVNIKTIKPVNPFLVTPLGIAMNC